MPLTVKEQLEELFSRQLTTAFPGVDLPVVELEPPAQRHHGDLACHVALKSAGILRRNPLQIAEEMRAAFQEALEASPLKEQVAALETCPPGFINIRLSQRAVCAVLDQVLAQKNDYGRSSLGQGQKVQVEFVSANPTGPLSVAHGRQAAVGDALVNILNFLGFAACREYYVNDGGNQIRLLGRSLACRARELLGEEIPFPEDGYQGEYIKEMARVFIEERRVTSLSALSAIEPEAFEEFGKRHLLGVIRQELEDFGVRFDTWSYESRVASKEKIQEVLQALNQKGLTYEQDGALWFASTRFGDDKDRVLRKSDGTYTYLSPDIAYHKDKFARGFQKVFDILGPDHHGYIKRITAAAVALGQPAEALRVLIVQLATIYRHGQKVSMSTRGGQYITLREVMREVGPQAARFFFLMRSMKAHLDFDLDLAKKQSSENPVYYIQYAHARICSVMAQAARRGLQARQKNFERLAALEERDLIKKLEQFPRTVRVCQQQMDPYPLVPYLQELAGLFHKFYDRHRVVTDDEDLSAERLGLIQAARIVLANGLRLLGLQAPEKM